MDCGNIAEVFTKMESASVHSCLNELTDHMVKKYIKQRDANDS